MNNNCGCETQCEASRSKRTVVISSIPDSASKIIQQQPFFLYFVTRIAAETLKIHNPYEFPAEGEAGRGGLI